MIDHSIYLLTPPVIANYQLFANELPAIFETAAIGCLQVRLKPATQNTTVEALQFIEPICARYKIPIIINDYPVNGHGLHIGQEDIPLTTARKKLPAQSIIGVSCYNNFSLAKQAEQDGASYVAFGAFYPSKTKQAKTIATPAIIQQWKAYSPLPCVAIGGITAANVAPIIQAGANMVAVCNSLWHHPNGAVYAATELKEAINENKCQ